ncbi:MAG: 50S ribosomal protein L1 [Omnitrophica bacterium GWA2_52_12]|nr:MAG: 50S ribosomal protein L1 [Omnitrophica bacterium GWA2_52_12]
MEIKGSKRYLGRRGLVEALKAYPLEEAVKVIKQIKDNKYDETLSLNFQLGIKPDQSDQMIRGTVSLPHGSGKKVRVVCICKGDAAREATAEGADAVGAEDLVAKIQGGWLDFDALVAHPDMMREVSKLGRVLGPKGLMPSPKTGTVTPNVGRAVKELRAGRIEFKTDKTAGMHAVCGKLSFSEQALVENARVIIKAVRDAKPSSAKGDFLRRVTLAPSQGPGVALAISSL